MKKRTIRLLLGMSVAAMMMSAPAAVMAGENEAAEETVEEAAEDADVITVEDVTIKNYTGRTFEAEKTETGLLLKEEGCEHVFENVNFSGAEEIRLTEDFGYLYLNCVDASGSNNKVHEKKEEVTLPEKVTGYITVDVNVRAEASSSSALIEVLKAGDEVQVVGSNGEWVRIALEDKEAFVYNTCITSSEDEIERQKEEAAKRAEAQTYTYDYNYSYSYAAPGAAAPTGPVVVGRENFADCDGSGHGYYAITYSDGSVVYQDY